MLFNSFAFLCFFAVFYSTYLVLQGRLKLQNVLLLLGSYVFYGWWDVRFLSLIVLSTVIDFVLGRRLDASPDEQRRKRLVTASVVMNLSVLGFFKYFNFFADTASAALNGLGLEADPMLLDIVLPVGISFYTFQTMSYTIDIYRRRMTATKSLLDFAVFVAFFPQLVAGPIERASHLLPQVEKPRAITAEEVNEGFFLICYGFFQKVYIADGVAPIVNEVFGNHTAFVGADLLVAVVAFTIQIYGDFSGYSKIARGLAKLMGFDLMLNFRLPYFARNPSEFWQRWHISLSSWLRDYLYIPLGGNRGRPWLTYRNLCLTMLLGGLWHGAAWNYVLWGAYHGLLLVIYRLAGEATASNVAVKRILQTRPVSVVRWVVMLAFTMGGWLLFRGNSAEQIWYFAQESGFAVSGRTMGFVKVMALHAWPLLVLAPIQEFSKDLLIVLRLPWYLQGLLYAAMITLTLALGNLDNIEFLYFQF